MTYPEILDLARAQLLNPNDLIKIILSGVNKSQWRKVTIRPVLLRNRLHFQFSFFDDSRDLTKNFDFVEADQQIKKLSGANFSQVQVVTRTKTLSYSLSGKGYKAKESEHALALEPDLGHDRNKNYPINLENALLMLQTIGIATRDERIKADMQSKFQQINEFIKQVSLAIGTNLTHKSSMTIVDCGCGNAYLTFALYHYFNEILHLPTTLVGLDVRGDLLKTHRRHAKELDWQNMKFVETKIIDFTPLSKPDIVLSLHACDTATDEALAKAVQWDSEMIFAVPCCHHELQVQMEQKTYTPAIGAILREKILRERLGDILTDTFRTLLLRQEHYRADVVQFVSSEHTAKNLMIRAVKNATADTKVTRQEYLALKTMWSVTPYLEKILHTG